ncbi:3-isopropylmalate dehydratase small subunit, partial [Alphaproteobacteria bacterium]|nr:3-isopropylmalate dehydratase small subunit [Alphaproteobacteria bacterium]
CVLSTSFADIFYNNCFQNGILPIVVTPEQLDQLMTAASNQTEFHIDLPQQTIKAGNHSFNFEIEEFRKLFRNDHVCINVNYWQGCCDTF